jgi:Uma2 family endonuclease
MSRSSSSSAPGPERNDPAVEAAFNATPPEMVAEIIDGQLQVMPRPRPRHARVTTRLAGSLSGFGGDAHGPQAPGGWVLLIEPELHLGTRPDILVPDLAGWRRERFPAAQLEASDEAAISVAPDWVCEVLSDSTEAMDRGKKRRIYRRESVGFLWYADPRDRSLEVWRLIDAHWVEVETFEGDVVVRAPPFESLELDLGLLWRW